MTCLKTKVELSTILEEHLVTYRRKHVLSAQQAKVCGSIMHCRTAQLGGHIAVCKCCGCVKVYYNSCRDRHCPKCQSLAKEQWLAARRAELLPAGHYHLVFTVPAVLHDLIRYNERLIYGAMFGQAWSSLKTLCADPKYLGARTGMLAVLHTWGQQLQYHPHIHALVPAGGLSFDRQSWVKPQRKKFLVPVRALSRLYRGRLVKSIRAAYRSGELRLPPGMKELRLVLDQAMRKEWVVYAKASFAGPHKLLDYLGRYVKRVAISNDRILSSRNGQVRFTYRDYADKNRSKILTLKAEEFIRRFLQHVLPARFCKLRYYGMLAIRDRQARLTLCHRLLNSRYQPQAPKGWQELLENLSGQHPEQCQDCEEGRMVIIDFFGPSHLKRGPPISASVAASQALNLPNPAS